MKFLFFISLFFTFSLTLKGQIQSSLDTQLVEFKAKMLTFSRFGLGGTIDQILKNVTNQDAVFLNTGDTSVEILRISFQQKNYQKGGESHRVWRGECSFLIGYNKLSNRFYRLGGFGSGDIVQFIENMGSSDIGQLLLLGIEQQGRLDYDIGCLIEFAEASERQRRNRKFDCLYKCEELMSQWVITP